MTKSIVFALAAAIMAAAGCDTGPDIFLDVSQWQTQGPTGGGPVNPPSNDPPANNQDLEGPWGSVKLAVDGQTYEVWLNANWYLTVVGYTTGHRYIEVPAGEAWDGDFSIPNGECIVLSVVGPRTHQGAGQTLHYSPYCP